MTRVFVTQEPIKIDPHLNTIVPTVNMESFAEAERFGEIVYVIKGLTPPFSEREKIIEAMHDVLQDFTADDILLGMGHPIIMCWAASIAAQYAGGRLSMLYYLKGPRQYELVRASLFDTEQETTQ